MYINLYKFYLPVWSHTIKNKSNSDSINAFVAEVVIRAGGCTILPVASGLWISPENVLLQEAILCLEVATTAGVRDVLIGLLKDFFPDQHAFLVVTLGVAEFIEGNAT